MAEPVEHPRTMRVLSSGGRLLERAAGGTLRGAWRRRRVQVAAGVLVMVTAGAGSHVAVSNATADALDDLRATRARTTSVAAETDRADTDVRSREAALVRSAAELEAAVSEHRWMASEAESLARHRDELLVQVGADAEDLWRAAESIERTGAEARSRGERITDLRTCLEGVNRALNLTSVGFPETGQRALSAVAADCRAAGAAP